MNGPSKICERQRLQFGNVHMVDKKLNYGKDELSKIQ